MNIVSKKSKTMFKNDKKSKTWADVVKGYLIDNEKTTSLLKYIKKKYKMSSLTFDGLEKIILDYLNIAKWDKKYIHNGLSLKDFLIETQLTEYLEDFKHLGLTDLFKIEEISLSLFPYTVCGSVFSKILDFDSKEYTYSLQFNFKLNKKLVEEIKNSKSQYNVKLTDHKKYIAFQFDLFNKVKDIIIDKDDSWNWLITMEFILDETIKLPTNLTLYLEKENRHCNTLQIIDKKTFKVEKPKEFNNECPICLEGFNGDDEKFITKCGHVFHTSCIKKGADNLFTQIYICKHEKCNHNKDENGEKLIYDYMRCPICRSV